VVDLVRAEGGRPFLTDTATLYSGSRSNVVDHIATAIAHGFDYAVVGAPVIIADGLRSGDVVEVRVRGRHFKKVKIAGDIARADSMVVVSHFKGHMLAGFGGAIKNLAMGMRSAGWQAGDAPGRSPRGLGDGLGEDLQPDEDPRPELDDVLEDDRHQNDLVEGVTRDQSRPRNERR
jgi:uncharacterized protein (DUF362 family)